MPHSVRRAQPFTPLSHALHQRPSRRTLVTGLFALTTLLPAGARLTLAQTSTPASRSAGDSPEQGDVPQPLPRDAVLTVAAVQAVIPEISYEAETGPNVTVMGTPVANRAVTFSSADDRQRIVLSVDQYGSADDARRAFDEAALASSQVPGVEVDSVSGLGEKALIGVATQGNETHVGGGALFGDLIVIATLQFFEGSDENKKRVATLIREEAELAARVVGNAT